jgi:hypothetical protein
VLARPKQVSAYSEACLDALAASGAGQWISVGGAFGLAHYFEYRATHDVDAWWMDAATSEDREAVIHVLVATLERFGTVRKRSWGDVVSVELRVGDKTVFSFQIARRSARLAEPVDGPWPGIRVDTFDDLLASKMVALVERGSPRDFLDIYTLCQHGRSTTESCWSLWRARQRAAEQDDDQRRAELAVRTHLARIERARPLREIDDPGARAAAAGLRRWFIEEFLVGLAD